jgi:hypothetical protein
VDPKTRTGMALAAAALGFVLSCKMPTNPMKAGAAAGTGIRLDHKIGFGGHLHADGYCQPLENCSACHGASLQGGAHGEPSCTSCHGSFWTDPNCGKFSRIHTLSEGGVMHGANPCQPQGVCTQCHGSTLEGGGNGEPACTKCHTAYWTSPNCGSFGHNVNLGGTMHKENYCLPYQNCTACHGLDLHGSGRAPSCVKCHTDKNWQNCGSIQHNKSRDGYKHATGPATTVCVLCHGADLRGGANREPSCYQCHGAVWNGDVSGHVNALGGVGHRPNYCQPQANCTNCHGANLTGGSNGEPSCTKCHGAYWTSASCGSFVHTVSLGGVLHKNNYCLPYQNCSSCHGVDLHGGPLNAPTCLKCHTQTKWKNCGTVQHTKSRDGVLHATGTATSVCVQCHGSDLRGGYNGESSCYKCHGKKW